MFSYSSAGRLDIPCVNIGVCIYNVDLMNGNAQSVVDVNDSAACFAEIFKREDFIFTGYDDSIIRGIVK